MSKIAQLFGRQSEIRERITDARDRLFRIAYSWCHDRHLADDLCQETIATALEKNHQLKSEGALDAWLFRILQNAYRKQFRKIRPQVDVESLEEHMEEEMPAEHDLERAEEIIQVRTALTKLKESHRQVVTLVDIEGMSYKQTAEVLDVPIGTVMSRLARARGELAQAIQDAQENRRPVRNNVRKLRVLK